MLKKITILGIFISTILCSYFFLKPSPQDATVITSAAHPSHEINLYHYFSGPLGGGIEEMLGQINQGKESHQVTAHALDHEAFKSMIHSTIAGGNPPELFTFWAGARTQALVDNNQLEPFDELWESLDLSSKFPPAISNAASTYNGEKYLLPITQHIAVFFYNKNLFAKENLTPPSTWLEFIKLCQALKNKGIPAIALGAKERWPAQFWFDYLLLRTAGPEYREELMTGNSSYSDKQVTEVYRTWSEMLQWGFFNADANNLDWSEAVKLVCEGKAATTLMGTWAIQLFTGDECNFQAGVDFDYFTFPIIDKTVANSAVGPIDGIVLTKNSSNHAFAKKVITYFAETDAQKFMSSGSGSLAPNQLVPKEFYSPFKQKLLKEISNTSHWVFNYDLATPPDVAEHGMDSFNELIAFPEQYKEILKKLDEEVLLSFEELQLSLSK